MDLGSHILLFYCKEIELENLYKEKLFPLSSRVRFVRRSPPSLVDHLLGGRSQGEGAYVRFPSFPLVHGLIRVYARVAILFFARKIRVEVVSPP